MAQSSIVTTTLADTNAIKPKDIDKLMFTVLANSTYWNIISGYGDTNKQIVKMKSSLDSKFMTARDKKGFEAFNALGIARPNRIKTTNKNTVQIQRAGSLPDEFTFTSANYTAANMNASPNSFDLYFASPGGVMVPGGHYQFATDNGSQVQFVVKALSPITGGGGRVTVAFTSGTVSGNTTNSVTAKKVRYMGLYRGAGSPVQVGRVVSESVTSYSFGKIQQALSVTPEAQKTKMDTEDQLPYSTQYYVQTVMQMIKGLNNALLLADGSTTLYDESNNPYTVPDGIFNMSGIDTYSGSGGLGPTLLNQIGRDLVNAASSPDCPWEIGPGGLPIIDVLADETRCGLFDDVLRTTTVFGTSIQNRTGESIYDAVLDMYKTRYCWYRLHYENTLDNSAHASKLLFFNRNTIVPVFKEGFFFNIKHSTGDSNANIDVDAVTAMFLQAIRLVEQIKIATSVTGLET